MGSQLGSSDGEIIDVMKNSGPASTGLTFIWMPQLFEKILFGKPLTILFFLGLTLAGFSSLISQLELTVRTFIDGGMKRSTAIILLVIISYLFGIPSAMNLNILTNQDFVWGLALLLSGGLFAFEVVRPGLPPCSTVSKAQTFFPNHWMGWRRPFGSAVCDHLREWRRVAHTSRQGCVRIRYCIHTGFSLRVPHPFRPAPRSFPPKKRSGEERVGRG